MSEESSIRLDLLELPDIEHDTRVPFDFEKEPYKFMLWLNRQEWALCFALSAALEWDGQMELELPIPVAMLAVANMLEHQDGFEFEGIKTTVDGKMFARLPHPVEVENLAWVLMINSHDLPEPGYRDRTLEAIEFCENNERVSSHAILLRAFCDHIDKEREKPVIPDKGFEDWVSNAMRSTGGEKIH